MISLVFFYLIKLLFSGFLQFKGNFGSGQNNSKYRDRAPLMHGEAVDAVGRAASQPKKKRNINEKGFTIFKKETTFLFPNCC